MGVARGATAVAAVGLGYGDVSGPVFPSAFLDWVHIFGLKYRYRYHINIEI